MLPGFHKQSAYFQESFLIFFPKIPSGEPPGVPSGISPGASSGIPSGIRSGILLGISSKTLLQVTTYLLDFRNVDFGYAILQDSVDFDCVAEKTTYHNTNSRAEQL